ncbi:glycerol-3-phosphate dehydrogenase/oxidase [Comamonas sp. NLF-1-9]|uniref:glycerol-3-phosphate dehydrogenase/oxidase n=1 Tax=Comamonas sp. NLF-1-9 TaxID=2853163 RepID=UPI001C459758|nr:glycerol-3-phosphate dehydrogenase/oxidase [Comamonas sp. NLF-1-9]QXL83660.1 glycerol-3-phosphate dehydrogenase/oxidase [Comamonas sp. NLF-1-9]
MNASSTLPVPDQRSWLLEQLEQRQTCDLIVVGGGATGLGVALDAAARGLSVVLLESHDFAKGTSSRATKLVHGGVRYLAQGNISLVREALRERAILLRNAPHLAQPLAFIMPSYQWWEKPFYGAGLTAYDVLAGNAGLGHTQFLDRAQVLRDLPTVAPDGLKGGIKYWDGQFDDARLALALARTAQAHGALVVNYCPVIDLLYEESRVRGVVCEDAETGRRYKIQARCVVNATGVWVDRLRQRDGEIVGQKRAPIVAPSQGVHLVVDREFLASDHALMVPKTRDGRVMFAVPWLGKVILGTTDSLRHDMDREPRARFEEVSLILAESARYLRKAPTAADVRSIWVGLRPLVKPSSDDGENTKALSREHAVLTSSSGLVTVTGGKWTTYRAIAEDVLEKCMEADLLPCRPAGVTASLALAGALPVSQCAGLHRPQGMHIYGSDEARVQALPGADVEISPGLTEAMVRHAAREEYARTVEDVLARRVRLLFLDARLSGRVAPHVAHVLQQELNREDVGLQAFELLAAQYAAVP